MTKPSNDQELRDAVEMWVELALHKFHADGDVVVMGDCTRESVSEILARITAQNNNLLDDLLRELEDKRRDIEANFDITEDGGIDHPDTESGHEHALQFADWTGYNLALSEFKQIIEGKKHD